MIALYCARFASVNCAASSVVSTEKLFVAASAWIVWIPLVMESCRKPAVAEKIRTLNEGVCAEIGRARETQMPSRARLAHRRGALRQYAGRIFGKQRTTQQRWNRRINTRMF